MKEQIELLSNLEQTDDLIDEHQGNLERIPRELQEIARNLVAIRREVSEIREKLSDVDKELRQKERDLETEQEKIKNSEKRLLKIKNQKEYNALSRQIKLGKRVVSEIEEAILGYMDRTEELRRILQRKEQEYAAFEEKLAEKKAEEAKVAKVADKALGKLKADREKIVAAIDHQFLKRYQMVRNALGRALAEMNNGSCTACHMAVPPQLNIRVLKQEEIISCPSCQRILYVKPENIPQYNKMDA